MPEEVKDLLERLNIPKESVCGMKFVPGCRYLIVVDATRIDDKVWDFLTKKLGEVLHFDVACIKVYGKPDNVISAFKFKE